MTDFNYSTMEEALDHLYKALNAIKRLPMITYDAPKIIGAMVNIESTIDSLETHAKEKNNNPGMGQH